MGWTVQRVSSLILVVRSGHRARVAVITFIREGTQLVSGSDDTDIIVWDVLAEAGLFRLHGHTGSVTPSRVVLSPPSQLSAVPPHECLLLHQTRTFFIQAR